MELVHSIMKRAVDAPDAVALCDCHATRITYARLDRFSGCVYRYLKAKGIGREDFVCILLPRGVEPFIAMLGVWKAGAAFVVLEEGYPAERVAFIQKDCGCRLVLDFSVWQELQHCEPLQGCEEVGDHDAAFAVYTSGSTGNPKGVLHEYGNVDRIAASSKALFRFGLIAPLNFVASVIAFSTVMSYGGTLFVIPYATTRNPSALSRCFVDHKITETFCAPSIYRLFAKIPSLNVLIVSSEPAYGIWSEDPKLEVYNAYGMSESGVLVTIARLDAPNDIAPIGQPLFDLKITLRDEDGNAVREGEAGEICFESAYVRGYINLPEQTAHAFVNGEYHTGDLGKRLPNGDYVVLGRIDDMIKINGNRVEPAEVENAVRRVTGLTQLIAKGFTEGESAFICLYYVSDAALDVEKTRAELSKLLPYYMIPSQFIRLETLPRTQSGKLSRRLLPKPAPGKNRGGYVAPANDVERALCEVMAKVLKLDRVGAADDFYALGGSSITSIEAVGQCALGDLTVDQIFRGRTPRRIAELYLAERMPDDGLEQQERNRAAMSRAYPLTEEQRYMFDYQLYTPKSTMLNLPLLLRLDREIDANRLCGAVNAMLSSHPAFFTVLFFNDDGELQQRYAPELFHPVAIESISEGEMEALKDALEQPFHLIGCHLYRCRLFRTEAALYLFLDIHHMLADGTSMKIMLRELSDRCLGDAEPAPYAPDNYYLMLDEREKARRSPQYQTARDYYEKRYGGVCWAERLKCEIDTRKNSVGTVYEPLGIAEDALDALSRQAELGRNGILIAAELMALAAYNGAPDALITWIYKGRDSKRHENIVGLLFRELPAALRLKPEGTLREIFADVRQQIQEDLGHTIYPYIYRTSTVKIHDHTAFNYEEDNFVALQAIELKMEALDIESSQDASPTALDVEIAETGEGLYVDLVFSEDRFPEAEVRRFMDMMRALLRALVAHGGQQDCTLKALFEAASLPFPGQTARGEVTHEQD